MWDCECVWQLRWSHAPFAGEYTVKEKLLSLVRQIVGDVYKTGFRFLFHVLWFQWVTAKSPPHKMSASERGRSLFLGQGRQRSWVAVAKMQSSVLRAAEERPRCHRVCVKLGRKRNQRTSPHVMIPTLVFSHLSIPKLLFHDSPYPSS